MFSIRAILSSAVLLGAAMGLAGCGVGPGPDLAGPRGPELMRSYSGDWALLRMESDDLDAKYREAMVGRPGPQTGMRPGGRSGGMPPGGGGFPRGGGGMTGGRGGGMAPGGVAVDPDEMRRVFEATGRIAHTPTEIGLDLRPDGASFRPEGSGSIILPLAGEEEIRDGDFTYFAAARWTDEGLIVERKVDGGGKVKDRLQVDDEGRLVVKREIDALRGGTVKGTLVYVRKDG